VTGIVELAGRVVAIESMGPVFGEQAVITRPATPPPDRARNLRRETGSVDTLATIASNHHTRDAEKP
jgi:hypothetical protein